MAARGEIIDRIAASVDNRVIMASDLDREIRVTAFQDRGEAGFQPGAQTATLQAMIEQKLIQIELEQQPLSSAGPRRTGAGYRADSRRRISKTKRSTAPH